jgi:[acyl-carrier-protein] S-malonyltransferase
MHEACQEKLGKMAVVLGMSAEQVDFVVNNLNINDHLWVANYNCPGQVVISGTEKGVATATEALLQEGAKRVMPLQVAGAFHSGLMKSAEEKLRRSIAKVTFRKGPIDLVMNVPGSYVEDISAIPSLLAQQVTHPVKWEQGVKEMESKGINCFIEMGCGKVLSGLNRKIGILGETLSIEEVADLEKAAPILEGE